MFLQLTKKTNREAIFPRSASQSLKQPHPNSSAMLTVLMELPASVLSFLLRLFFNPICLAFITASHRSGE